MSAKFNNFCELEIVGTVTKDPEAKFTPDGKLFTNVSLVYNDFVGKSDTNTKGTVAMWVHLTAWEKTAEIVNQYLHKGDVLHAKCRIRFDAQTGNPRIFTRNDGSVGSTFEATIKECTIISKGNGNGANGSNDAEAFTPNDFDAYQGQPESAPQQFVPQTPAPQQFVPQQAPQYQQPAPQQQFVPQQPRPQQFVPQPQAQPQYQPQAAPQQPQAPQQYQQPQQQQGGFTVPQQAGNNGKRSW